MIPQIKQYEISVTKKSGDKAPFDQQKIYNSLKSVGVSDQTAEIIIRAVKLEAYDGISTREIYKKTFNLLRKYSRGSSVRYRLRDAITQLGSTGYPFERFVGDLFIEKGYDVKVGMLLKGLAVTHEIDVVAQNHDRIFTIECKYHVNPSAKSDVKVPMYILSRYKDLENAWSQYDEFKGKTYQQWIATNTRFTEDAITFAETYGLKILSWDYPKGQGLKDWIQLYGMFPITCLSCISKAEKELLVAKEIVSCRSIYKNPHILDNIPMSEHKKAVLKKELSYLYDSVLAEGEHLF